MDLLGLFDNVILPAKEDTFLFELSRIQGDTAPSFDALAYKLDFLKKGIELKVNPNTT